MDNRQVLLNVKEISTSMNNAGNPHNILKKVTAHDPLEVLQRMGDSDSLANLLFEGMGDLAYNFATPGGLLVKYDAERGGFYFEVNPNGVGLRHTGTDRSALIHMVGIVTYLMMYGSSEKAEPIHVDGKQFFITSTINPEWFEIDSFLASVGASYENFTEEEATAVAAQCELLKDKTTKEKYRKLLPWLEEFKPGFLLALPKEVYDEIGGSEFANAYRTPSLAPAPIGAMTKDSVVAILTLLASVINSGSNTYIDVIAEEDDTYTVIFDNQTRYRIDDEGVEREGLRVQNLIVEDAPNNEIAYYDSYGSFLIVLLDAIPGLYRASLSNAGNVIPVGKWEKRTLGKYLPLDREVEQGMETKGARAYYNGYVAKALKAKGRALAFSCYSNDAGEMVYDVSFDGLRLSEDVNKSEMATRSLMTYNSWLSSKSMTWMDGRLIRMCLRHVPSQYQEATLYTWLMDVSGEVDPMKAITKLFKVEVNASNFDAVKKWLISELEVYITLKDSKADSRIKLGLATTPSRLHGGKKSAWIREDQYHQGAGFDVVFRYPCVLGNTIIGAPGIAEMTAPCDWFFVQYTLDDTLEQWDPESIFPSSSEYEVDVHPSGEVTLTFTQPTDFAVDNGLDVIKLNSYAVEENGTVSQTSLTGLKVNAGDTILMVGYTNDWIKANVTGGMLYHEFKAPIDSVISKIVYRANAYGSLEVKCIGDYPFNFYKGRGGNKCMLAYPMTGKHYLYNELNSLPDGIKLVVTSDTLKYKDLLMKALPYFAGTAVENGFTELIESVNTAAGYPGVKDTIIYSYYADSIGVYKPLEEWFWNRYGQAVWVYRRDVADGMHSVNMESYIYEAVEASHFNSKDPDHYWISRKVEDLYGLTDVEMELPIPEGKFGYGDGVVVLSSCESGNPNRITKYDDIMVFRVDSTEHVPLSFWQRGFVAASIVNELGEVEHTYVEMKPELSDFRANSTKTKLMQGIARVVGYDNGITKANPGLAAALTEDYKQRCDKYAALMGISKGYAIRIDGVVLPEIDVYKDGEISAEFWSLVSNELMEAVLTQDTDSLLRLMHNCFNRVVLKLEAEGRVVKVFVPAIAEQDLLGKSTDSTSGLLKDLLKSILENAKVEDVKQRVARLKAAVEKIVGESDYSNPDGMALMRQMSQGRKSVLAKAVGMAGIPVDVAAACYSRLKGSVYQNLLEECIKLGYTEDDLLSGNLWLNNDGDMKCIRARSPLLFVHYLRIVIIRPGLFTINLPEGVIDVYDVCDNPWVVYVNPIVAAIDAGDYDGDGNSFTIIERKFSDVSLTTNGDCRHAILLRTGMECTAKAQGEYFKDHYFPKRDIKGTVYDFTPALSEKNFKLATTAVKDGKIVEKGAKSSTDICTKSAINYQSLVGSMYQIFMEGQTSIDINYGLADGDGLFTTEIGFACKSNLTFPLGELYEAGPLGGLSWGAYAYCTVLQNIMFGITTIQGSVNEITDDKKVEQIGPDYYRKLLNDTSFNQEYGLDYADVAENIYKGSKLALKIASMSVEDIFDYEFTRGDFLIIAAKANFYATKGQFNVQPDGRRARIRRGLALAYLACMRKFDLVSLEHKNIVVRFLNYFIPMILKVQVYPNKVDLFSFMGWDIDTIDLDSNSFVDLV